MSAPTLPTDRAPRESPTSASGASASGQPSRSPLLLGSLAAASAGLLTLAAPPFDLGWLGWVAPVPFFWGLLRSVLADPGPTGDRSAGWRTGRLGFLHGFLSLFFLVPWFAAFTPAGYPVAAAYWGLISGIVWALVAPLLRRVPRALAPPVLAAGWTVIEWLHTCGTLAFPWGSLALTQYRHLRVLQLLDLTGSFGLSFLMALAAAAVAAAFSAPEKSGPRPRFWPQRVPATLRGAGMVWGTAAVLTASLSMVRGAWLLAHPAPMTETLRAGVVQESESRMAPGAAVICVSPLWRYLEESRSLVRAGADLVVWPECACRDDALHNPLVRQELGRLLSGSRTRLLAGSFIRDPASRQGTNSSVLVSPDGEVEGQYTKVYIVPFGEYLPVRPLLSWTTSLGMPPDDLKAGTGWTPLRWDRASVGVSICFESAFGSIARDYTRQGANLLAVLTSDGWSGRGSAGLQHAAFAPLRAVETRRSVVRAAATGVSELIDPYGRPLLSLPMFTRGSRMADVPLRHDRTLYTLLGDWPVWLCWLFLGLLAILHVRFLPRRVN